MPDRMTSPPLTAAKLKPAHREIMLGEAVRTGDSLELRAHLHPGQRCYLQRQGLLVDQMYSQVLTPLGLAVRDALNAKTGATRDA